MAGCNPVPYSITTAVRNFIGLGRHTRDPTEIPPESPCPTSADQPIYALREDKQLIEDDPIADLPDLDPKILVEALQELVEHSATHTHYGHGIYASTQNLWSLPWIHKLIPGIEKLANQFHMGNFIIDRATGEKKFEFMPLYVRIGMHLLFCGKLQRTLLDMDWLQDILQEQTVKQGRIYDGPESAAGIPSFVETYEIPLDQLLEPDVTKYKCFNDFFYRSLKPGSRPVENIQDEMGICSAADCRLVVYPTMELSTKFWVKGNDFDIPHLLNVDCTSPLAKQFTKHGPASVAIFRLAPQDYHRFHSPVDGTVGDIVKIPGEYYTVNPLSVNQEEFEVFTANIREVLYMTHKQTGLPVAFVAVGALLVGSVRWTGGGTVDDEVKRGDELGYFAYGGSTVVVIFANGVVEFDEDLKKNSQVPIETLVQVGSSLGKTPRKKGLFDKLF